MNEMIPTPRNRKPWIRRHKILAVVAPFVALILFLSAWMGIRGACVPSAFEPDSSPWNRFLSNAMDGFIFSVFSWMAFVEDWARLRCHHWFAYPLYVVPVIVFISTRNNRTAIISYTLFCLLVCAAFFFGLEVTGRVME
jgi:hypothetical protein